MTVHHISLVHFETRIYQLSKVIHTIIRIPTAEITRQFTNELLPQRNVMQISGSRDLTLLTSTNN